jgi:ABC transport system ATP-binding/permease protein
MSVMLQVDNLSRSYGEHILFDNISFVIGMESKVGLIAKNGSGKTSLLNIIAGMEPADQGKVTYFGKSRIGYLQQQPVLDPHQTVFNEVYATGNDVLDAVTLYEKALRSSNQNAIDKALELMDARNGWEYETRIKQILSILDIPDLEQLVGTLSGGQQKRIALAKLLIVEPDFMILDEPTNHLDVQMIEWLEETLSQRRKTFLMVTHDRYFLDRICDEILELDHTGIHRYKGGYHYFIGKQAQRLEHLDRETEKAKNLLRKEQDWINRMPKERTTKSKARIDSYHELKEVAHRHTPEDKLQIAVEGKRVGKKILEMHDVFFDWDNLPILKGFTYTFKRNEKIGIVGNNGTGKTTFLDLVTGSLKPSAGSVKKGETIRFGYYTQEGISFKEDAKVIEVVREIADVVKLSNGDSISAAAFLNYFLFPYPVHHQKVSTLSGGEKRRLYLVTILMQNPNFLILDEPTNDLDILTLNVLEEFLESFAGCVMVVTHDRYFLDKVVDHLFVFEGNGVLRDFPGNYSRYREHAIKQRKHQQRIKQQQKESQPKKIFPESQKKQAQINSKTSGKLTYKEKREMESLEKEIEQLDAEKATLITKLESGKLTAEELQTTSTHYADIIRTLDQKESRWLELSEKES